MKTNICVLKQDCALADIVVSIAAEKDENREEQNARAWGHIISKAETSGDGLDYDGPLTWA